MFGLIQTKKEKYNGRGPKNLMFPSEQIAQTDQWVDWCGCLWA